MTPPARTLTLLDCVAIGINGIVGSGIYLLIGPLAARAGNASVVGIFACGVLCILIALCFAELGGMFDRNGGPFVYARAAFGPQVGFVVGWMSLAVGVLAFAAVAVGFADALARLWPGLATPASLLGLAVTGKTAVSGVLILTLGGINYLGVKAGARTSDALSIAKLAPLLLLALVGLFFLRGDAVAAVFDGSTLRATAEAPAPSYLGAVASSAFLAVFMLSGFEFVSVPAGEARQARRNIPIAIVGSLTGATLLYCVLQLVALSVVPDLHAREQPLIDAAKAIFGGAAEKAFVVGSLISMAGFCAGSALVGPRYFTALAEHGYFAPRLTELNRFGTPGAAIVLATLLSFGLALVLGYATLVDVSNVALFMQYIPTALAVIVLRWRLPAAERRYRLPGGPLIPALAAGASVWLIWMAKPKAEEWTFSGEILGVGLVVWLASWGARRLRPKTTAAQPRP